MSIFYSKEQDGTMNVRVTGYLTKDPKVLPKVVLFSVCYGKGKFMDCRAWANDTIGQIASCMEKHDALSVEGVYEQYEKDGETKKQLAVDGIYPMTLPTAASEPPMNEPGPDDVSTSSFSELVDADGGELPF